MIFEKLLTSFGENFDHLDAEFEQWQLVMENADNISKKTNIWVEGVEGDGLLQYLE